MTQIFRSSLLLLWVMLCPPMAFAAAPTVDAQSGLPIIALTQLPKEAHDTMRTIKQGGPYAYERDGVVFKNFERILPQRSRGYYREYTVKTPGIKHRGARRIVCGPLPECYYSADHYLSFKRISF